MPNPAATSAPPNPSAINPAIAPHLEALWAFRQDMHQHPEIGYEEQRAGDKVVAFMQQLLGIGNLAPMTNGSVAIKGAKTGTLLLEASNSKGSILRGLGRTGVVVSIYGKGYSKANPGPAVGIRGDMDALPMPEKTGLPYASVHKGKMHACGHDGHTTMVVGASILLAEAAQKEPSQGGIAGTVHLIFQPAEEVGAGGKAMLDDGLLLYFPMSAAFGLHNMPGIDLGKMVVRPGPILSGSRRFEITIKGKGGHAAMPHTTIDPIPVACALVTQAQTIVSRRMDPLDAAVLTFGTFHAGTVANIIPAEVKLSGTIRTLKATTQGRIVALLQLLCDHVPKAHNCTAVLNTFQGYPATNNSAHEAAFMAKVMAEVVGPHNSHPSCAPVMGSEDFGFVLEAVPGAYGFIGNTDLRGVSLPAGISGALGSDNHGVAGGPAQAGHAAPPSSLNESLAGSVTDLPPPVLGCLISVHNPKFDFNNHNIGIGATFFDRLAREWLAEGIKGQPAVNEKGQKRCEPLAKL